MRNPGASQLQVQLDPGASHSEIRTWSVHLTLRSSVLAPFIGSLSYMVAQWLAASSTILKVLFFQQSLFPAESSKLETAAHDQLGPIPFPAPFTMTCR